MTSTAWMEVLILKVRMFKREETPASEE